MRRKILYKRIVLCFALLFVAAVFGGGCSKKAPTVKIGEVSPTVTFADTSGKQLAIPADTMGGMTVLLFWHEGCAYCKREMSNIQPLYEKHKDRGFKMVGIHIGDAPAAVDALVKEHSLTFPMLVDKKSASEKRFGIVAVPTMFVLDAKGIVREKILGGLGAADLEKMIGEMI